MRSATPKVLHRLAGRPLIDHVLQAAATSRRPPRPWWSATRPTAFAPISSPGPTFGRSSRSRSSAPATPCCTAEPRVGRPARDGSPALWRRAAAEPGQPRRARHAAPGERRRRHGRHGHGRTALRLRPNPQDRRRDRPDRRGARRRAGRTGDQGDQRRHLCASTLESLFDALRDIGAENAQGEYYLPDLVAVYRRQRKVVATWTVANPSRDPRHQQPQRAGRGRRDHAPAQARGVDGRRGSRSWTPPRPTSTWTWRSGRTPSCTLAFTSRARRASAPPARSTRAAGSSTRSWATT